MVEALLKCWTELAGMDDVNGVLSAADFIPIGSKRLIGVRVRGTEEQGTVRVCTACKVLPARDRQIRGMLSSRPSQRWHSIDGVWCVGGVAANSGLGSWPIWPTVTYVGCYGTLNMII